MSTPSPATGTLPAVIRGRYRAKGWTDEQFADAANIAYRTFRRRLKGTPFPSDELARVAQALGTTVSTLWLEVEAQIEDVA